MADQFNAGTSKAGGCIAIGCGIPLAIGLFTALASSGGAGVFFGFLIVALIITAVVLARRGKLNTGESTNASVDPYAKVLSGVTNSTVPEPVTRPDTYNFSAPANSTATASSSSTGSNYDADEPDEYFHTYICGHVFTEDELASKNSVTCPCGYKFPTTLLRKYKKANDTLYRAQQDYDKVTDDLYAIEVAANAAAAEVAEPVNPYARSTSTAPIVRTAASTASAASTTVAAPKPAVVKPPKEKIKRKRVTLAPQQWLVIGASAIIFIGAIQFIFTGVNAGWSPWAFLAITASLSAVTGFLAFWSRKFSVLLSNFMATFSSAMVFASMDALTGIVKVGVWNDAPAWWWALTFAVTAGLAYPLARISGNFGWKAIALLGYPTAGLFLAFGPVLTWSSSNAQGHFGWFTSTITVCAVTLALVSRSIRGIKYKKPIEKENEAYEKDLAKREDAGIQRYTVFASTLLAAVGFGYFVINLFSNFTRPFDALSTSVLALVWIGATAVQSRWVPEFVQSKDIQAIFNTALRTMSYLTVAASLTSLIHLSGAAWFRAIATGVLAIAIVFAGHFIKRIQDNPIALRVSHLSVLVTWMTWNLGDLFNSQQYAIAGTAFLLFALSSLINHWYSFNLLSSTSALASHAVGVSMLVWNLQSQSLATNTLGYALGALLLVLLVVAYSPALGFIDKKHEHKGYPITHWVILGVSLVLTLVLSAPDASVRKPSDLVNLTLAFALTGAVALVLRVKVLAKSATQNALLLTYACGFQALALALLFTGGVTQSTLGYSALGTGLIAAFNYAIGLWTKHKISINAGIWLGLVAAVLGIESTAATSNLSTLLAEALVISVVFLVLNGRVSTKRGGLSIAISLYLNVVVFLAIVLGELAAHFDKLATASAGEGWLVLGELLLGALASAILAERPHAGQNHRMIILRLNALLVSVVAFAALPGVANNGDVHTVQARAALAALVFGAIVLRQSLSDHKGKSKLVGFGWFAASYLSPLVLAYIASDYLQSTVFAHSYAPEVRSIPTTLAVLIPAFLHRRLLDKRKNLLLIDLPALALLGYSLAYSIRFGYISDENHVRTLITLALLAAFAYWRSSAEKLVAWALAGYATTLVFSQTLVADLYAHTSFNLTGPDAYTVAAALAVVVGNVFLLKRVTVKPALAVKLRIDLPVLIPVVISLIDSFGLSSFGGADQNRLVISLLLLAGFTFWRSIAEASRLWAVIGYVAVVAFSQSAVIDLFQLNPTWNWDGPDVYAIAGALAVVVGNYFLLKRISLGDSLATKVRVDLPALIPLVFSLAYSLGINPSGAANQDRTVITLLLIAAFTFWRSIAESSRAWAVIGYLSTLGFAEVGVADLFRVNKNWSWDGPEPFMVAASLAIVVGNFFLLKRISVSAKTRTIVSFDLPVLLPVAGSLIYAVANNPLTTAHLWRETISLAIVVGFSAWRDSKTKLLGWAIANYTALVALALTAIKLLYSATSISFEGPELYSLATVAAIVLGNRRLATHIKFKSSMITWGLPLAIFLLPSIWQSYAVTNLTLADLHGVDLTRVLVTLVVALAAFVLGIRRGNLGSALAGGAGLALVAIPGNISTDSLVSLRALLVGSVLVALLSLLRRTDRIPNKSVIYLGIPVAIAIAPSIYLSIAALAHPDAITTFDWWRFAIVVASSLALLIVGALRELAGMFFPGLVSVLLAVLPYAFSPVGTKTGLLWIVLILIAAVMIWVAMRLDKMAKAGRSPSQWMKSLK